MGLFDAYKGQKDISLSPEEAVAALLLIAVAADGVIEPQEMRVLLGSAIRIKAFGKGNPDTVFKKLGKLIQKHGLDKLAAAACEKIEPDHRKAVYLHFLDILVSDGTVAPEEERIAVGVKDALGLTDDFAKNAFDLLQEKNKL